MMNNRFAGYILFCLGIIFLLDIDLLFGLNRHLIILSILLIVGLSGTFVCLGSGRRIAHFIFTIIFLSGVLLFITGQYVLLNQGKILFPSVLFMIGAGFFMLFLDNTREIVFLITSIFLLLTSFILIFVLDGGVIIAFANRFILYGLEFWPGIIILIGFLLLSARYK